MQLSGATLCALCLGAHDRRFTRLQSDSGSQAKPHESFHCCVALRKCEVVSIEQRCRIWIFIRVKTHQNLFFCAFFYSKIRWEIVFIKKSNFCSFNIFFKLSTFIPAQNKNLHYSISIIHHIMLSPILNCNYFFGYYRKSCFFPHFFFRIGYNRLVYIAPPSRQ